MNFLEIAQRTRQEAGYAGSGPTSVEGQIGVLAKIISWVQMAYLDVQQENPAWRFRWATRTAALTAGLRHYHPAVSWGIKVRSLIGCPIYVFRFSDDLQRYWLAGIPWHEFRVLPPTLGMGIPTYWSEAPDGALHVYPLPMDGLGIVIEYQKSSEKLAGNLDIPAIPEEYHNAIMWRAVMYAAAHDENPSLAQSAASNYRAIINRMSLTELGRMSDPRPMA